MPPIDGHAPATATPGRRPAAQNRAGDDETAPRSPSRLDGPRVTGPEREFLPAALEILETPANPAGRVLTLSLAGFFVIAVAWSVMGRIDIVAVAQGRIVPAGGVKQIQPREIGSVRAIHVTDGMYVEAGKLLIELDPTESEVDKDQLQRERAEARVEVARLTAFIRGLEGLPPDYSPPDEDVAPVLVSMHRSQLESDLAAYQAEVAALRAELSRRVAGRAAIEAEVAKLEEMIPLLADREASLLKLLKQGHSPKPAWQDAKTRLIETRHDLTIQRYRLSEAESAVEAAAKERSRLTADRRRRVYGDLAQAQKTLEQSDMALRKAMKREALHQLRAPVSGTVQQLAVHTVGGVVQPAEPLAVIVPDAVDLEVRARVLNKDKGFVAEGQPAEIKLEAFNFTKYGTVHGEVTSVSSDAIEHDDLGLVYETRVSLASRTILAEGRDVPLTPGMTVMVEIKTGKRRVIEFLLSPLRRYQDEAIRER